MEIPELSEKEKQKIFVEMWTGAMAGSIGFIMRKLGPKAVEEFNCEEAKKCADGMRLRGVDSPLKFAMNYAVVNKNIFGSFVSVEGDENKALLSMKSCANLEAVSGIKEMPAAKLQQCGGCVNGYFKKVAENLGFVLEAEFTENGCKMTISRK